MAKGKEKNGTEDTSTQADFFGTGIKLDSQISNLSAQMPVVIECIPLQKSEPPWLDYRHLMPIIFLALF